MVAEGNGISPRKECRMMKFLAEKGKIVRTMVSEVGETQKFRSGLGGVRGKSDVHQCLGNILTALFREGGSGWGNFRMVFSLRGPHLGVGHRGEFHVKLFHQG